MIRILWFCLLSLVLVRAASLEEMASSAMWRNLLLVDDRGHSEILDENFYFTPQPLDLQKELEATLAQRSCENLCRFPARYYYLSKTLGFKVSFEHCENLNRFLERTRGESASLVFASSFVETPLSFFGHSFIKINKKENPLFSWTLGYAAQIESLHLSDTLQKAFQGELKGVFLLEPFYKLYEEYGIKEQRTLYEYPLNLSPEEIYQMLLRFYEVGKSQTRYGFLKKNCAYWVYALLEGAREVDLRHAAGVAWVLPKEGQDLLRRKGLLADLPQKIYPRQVDKLYGVYRGLSAHDKEALRAWLEDFYQHRPKDENLDNSNGVKFLMEGHYELWFKKYNYSKAAYNDVKKLRFKEPLVEARAYELGNGKVEFSQGLKGRVREFRLDPLLIDRYLDKTGEMGESSLRLMGTRLQQVDSHARLERLDLLSIESINGSAPFYTPVSWLFQLSLDRHLKDDLAPRISLGIGRGVDVYGVKFYALPILTASLDPMAVNLELLGGVSWWQGDRFHMGFERRFSVLHAKYKSQLDEQFYMNYALSNHYYLRAQWSDRNEWLIGAGMKF